MLREWGYDSARTASAYKAPMQGLSHQRVCLMKPPTMSNSERILRNNSLIEKAL